MNLKKATAIVLAAALVLTMTGCGSGEDEDEITYEIEDSMVYNVAVVRSADNVYINMLDQGFIDSISDQIGAEHLNVSYIIYSEEDEKLQSEYAAALAGETADGETTDTETADAETTDDETAGEEIADDTEDTQLSDDEEADDAKLAKTILPDYNAQDFNLIYTIGIPALQSVKSQTDTVPIVASGVVDFESVLGLQTTDEGWDSKTHTNVAGVQGLPPVDQQLSLMIEATPTLEAIGIVYREDDIDAIYQNEVLEKYLDQAGIPWKEYMIPMPVEETEESEDSATENSSDTADRAAQADLTDDAETAAGQESAEDEKTPARSDDEIGFYEMLFGRRYGASDKAEATEETQTENGETADSEAEAEETVRQPKQSALWDTYINALLAVEAEDYRQQELAAAEAAEENTEVIAEDETDDEQKATIKHPVTELPEDATETDIIEAASSVCDMLYISAGSYLIEDMETIGSIATENGVRTFSGDTTGGQYTLVSLYCDPYNMGYQAGKLAYKILVEGDEPGELKLSSPSSSAVQKLYNGEIADIFGMTFPKSFMEINEFETSYVPGSMTTRVKK